MKKLLLLLVVLCAPAFAQLNWFPNLGAGAPSNPCGNQQIYVNTSNGDLYTCTSAAWVKTGAGGGAGTVTSVTFTGDGTVLSSTPSSAVTTTGTVTGTLASAAAGTLLGNSTGGATTPTYGTYASYGLAPLASPAFTGTFSANGANLTSDANGNFTKVSGVTTINFGMPIIIATDSKTAQTATLGNTSILASGSNPGGRYALLCSEKVTTAAGTSSTLPNCYLSCTDPTDSVVANYFTASPGGGTGNTTATGIGQIAVCNSKAATTINYGNSGYASSAANAMNYDMQVTLVRIQ